MAKEDIVFSKEMFEPVNNSLANVDEIKRPSISYSKDVMIRLFKNKLAMTGLITIIIIFIMSIIGPIISNYDYFMPDFSARNQPPSTTHWFGTDEIGRDLFTRAWQAARVSLFIGVAAALLDFIIGVIYGGISGYLGGKVDDIMMRIAEILFSIPYLLMVIILSVILGSGIFSIVLAMAITGWVPMARLVRGQILQLKELEYVQAAKSFGADTKWILFKHLIPNAMGPIIVTVTLTVPRAIFAEATLSFLGLGVQPPSPSWGQMANDAIDQMLVGNLNVILVPSILISLTMFSFNVLGDGLRDALDPKLRK